MLDTSYLQGQSVKVRERGPTAPAPSIQRDSLLLPSRVVNSVAKSKNPVSVSSSVEVESQT